MLWFPFGKLAHAYMIFVSRGKTGMILERRGARLSRKRLSPKNETFFFYVVVWYLLYLHCSM